MSKRICIDFDQTIFDRRTGEMSGAGIINEWFLDGNEITIFTSRADTDYSTIKKLLDDAKIKYTRIICGKPMYDILIDDKAVKFEGWGKKYL